MILQESFFIIFNKKIYIYLKFKINFEFFIIVILNLKLKIIMEPMPKNIDCDKEDAEKED